MKLSRLAIIAVAAISTACNSDESTSPSPVIEARLAAAATVTSSSVMIFNVQTVGLRVDVTSALSEPVTGSSCARLVEARAPGGSSWVDVTAATGVCSTNILRLVPGSTAQLSAIADQAKLRALITGANRSVTIRVQHTLDGANASYTLQSNDVAFAVPS